MRHATIMDIAWRAGVSLQTVSRAINREAPVRGDTREKAERTIQALGHRHYPSARSRRAAHSFGIGLVRETPATRSRRATSNSGA